MTEPVRICRDCGLPESLHRIRVDDCAVIPVCPERRIQVVEVYRAREAETGPALSGRCA